MLSARAWPNSASWWRIAPLEQPGASRKALEAVAEVHRAAEALLADPVSLDRETGRQAHARAGAYLVISRHVGDQRERQSETGHREREAESDLRAQEELFFVEPGAPAGVRRHRELVERRCPDQRLARPRVE